MKTQYRILFAFAVLLSTVSPSCAGFNAPVETPTASIPHSFLTPSASQQTDTPTPASSASFAFVDKHNLLTFELPADWVRADESQSDLYTDTFTSPDGSAKIESLVYNDGQPFDESKNKEFALYLLNTYYSATGKTGDISITSDQIMDNGSQRLEWISKGSGVSGQSYFIVRGDDLTFFLMFTVQWKDGTDQATLDVIHNAIASFRIP